MDTGKQMINTSGSSQSEGTAAFLISSHEDVLLLLKYLTKKEDSRVFVDVIIGPGLARNV